MEGKIFYLTEQEINQISVALTLYVNTSEKCGFDGDSIPLCKSLINLFSK